MKYDNYDEEKEDHIYVIAEGADEVYDNTSVYKKDGIFYDYYYRFENVKNWAIEGKLGENYIDNISKPIYNAADSVFIYEGTDGLLHFNKYMAADNENKWVYYDETAPTGLDGMAAIYDFMQRYQDIEIDWS